MNKKKQTIEEMTRKLVANSLITKKLLKIARTETMCSIQENGCPCNTCFHDFFNEELGNFNGHLFWLLILAIRGDYTEEQIKEALKLHLIKHKD